MVIKRAKETSKDLPAVYTKMRIKKLKIDLTEYHGKPVGQKKGPEMDTSQPMKTMIDVLQVTYPNLSKEQEAASCQLGKRHPQKYTPKDQRCR